MHSFRLEQVEGAATKVNEGYGWEVGHVVTFDAWIYSKAPWYRSGEG